MKSIEFNKMVLTVWMLNKRTPETSISKRTKSIAIRNTTVWMLHKSGGENTSNLSTIPLWLETFKRDCNVWKSPKSTSTSSLLFSMGWYSGMVWKCHCMVQCGGGIVDVLWRLSYLEVLGRKYQMNLSLPSIKIRHSL